MKKIRFSVFVQYFSKTNFWLKKPFLQQNVFTSQAFITWNLDKHLIINKPNPIFATVLKTH